MLFSFEALDKLVLARRVLQWTYALAYYFKSGGQKSLFEYQQELLCGATESLQDIVDHNYSDLDRTPNAAAETLTQSQSHSPSLERRVRVEPEPARSAVEVCLDVGMIMMMQ